MRRFLSILLGTTLLSAVNAEAISLKEALRAAYESNPEIMASRARLAAVDETYNLAASQNGLTADIEGFYGASRRSRSTIFSGQAVQDEDIGGEIGLSIQKPLYQGGRVSALKRQSKADIEEARQNLRSVQQKVFLETTTSYIDVVFDEEVLRLQEKHQAILAEMQNLVTTREEIGVGTETDIWRINSRASAIDGDITRAKTNLEVSRTVFRQVTGEPIGEMNWGQSLSVPQSLDSAQMMARNNNPQLYEALSREDSAEAAIDVAKSAYKPTVALVGNSFITDDRIGNLDDDFDVDGVTVGLNFRMPLLSGGANKSRVNAAKHQLASRQFETALVERSIKSAVEQAWTQHQGAQSVRESIGQRLENAQKTYKNIKIEFELGTRTIFDVVEAEQDYLNSQVEYLQSRRAAERSAALLLASMGMTDTIPHIQQVLPTGVDQITTPDYVPLTKSDSPAQLGRGVPLRIANPESLPVHRVEPVDKRAVFATQMQTDSPADLRRGLRTRSVPQTMIVPTYNKPAINVARPAIVNSVPSAPIVKVAPLRPEPSREQIFASIRQTDSPAFLGHQIVTRNVRTMPIVKPVQPSTSTSVNRQQVFAAQMATDSPSSLGRRVPVIIRHIPQEVRVAAQPMLAAKFRHVLD